MNAMKTKSEIVATILHTEACIAGKMPVIINNE